MTFDNEQHPGTQDTAPEVSQALLTTGEMARRSANTLRTVRFYEEEGILKPVRRTAQGHRLFDRAAFERLMLVSDLRTAGLSLDEIREILALEAQCTSGPAAAAKARALLVRRLDETRSKLAALTRLEDDLAATTAVLQHCAEGTAPVIEACASCEEHRTTGLPRTLRILRGAPLAVGSAVPST